MYYMYVNRGCGKEERRRGEEVGWGTAQTQTKVRVK
jgi:hypothetical protein